jgi:hypothetical protein
MCGGEDERAQEKVLRFALRHLVKISHGALLELRLVNNQFAGNKKTKFL